MCGLTYYISCIELQTCIFTKCHDHMQMNKRLHVQICLGGDLLVQCCDSQRVETVFLGCYFGLCVWSVGALQRWPWPSSWPWTGVSPGDGSLVSSADLTVPPVQFDGTTIADSHRGEPYISISWGTKYPLLRRAGDHLHVGGQGGG